MQDVRDRAVSVVVFPLLLGCLGWIAFTSQPWQEVMANWGVNILFLAFQLVLLYLYFLVTRRRIIAVVGTAMGLGDLLFWLVAAVLFSLPAFILYFLGSLVFSLLLHSLLSLTFKEKYRTTVPLAGFQALVLLVLLGVQQMYPYLDFFGDVLVLDLLVW